MEVAVLTGTIGMFLTLVGTAVVFYMRDSLTERRRARALWANWASQQGLSYNDRVISGALDGRDLSIRTRIGQADDSLALLTVVRMRLRASVPGRLRITPERQSIERVLMPDIQIGDSTIDRHCTIECNDADLARKILGDADVRATLKPVLEAGGRIWLTEYHVEVAYRGQLTADLHRRVTQTTTLATALERAPGRPFRALAERLGWETPELPGGPWAGGTLGELTVRVRYREGKGPPHTVVRVQVPGLDRLGLYVSLEDYAGAAPRLELGDPIVDRLLHVHGTDEEAVRTLLRGDDLRAELLEVVHGHAGSAVARGAVMLAVPGFASDRLEELLDRAVALAERLLEGLARLDAPPGADSPDPG